jgi:hypothetical protein
MLSKAEPKMMLALILVITVCLCVLFAVFYGAISGKQEVYSAGQAVVTLAIGAIITYYFKNEESKELREGSKELKLAVEAWRKWYDNECLLEDNDGEQDSGGTLERNSPATEGMPESSD